MSIRTGILSFSPTRRTRTICAAVAAGMGDEQPRFIDITLPGDRIAFLDDPQSPLSGIDHLIVGAPVYAGKVAPMMVQALTVLRGNGSPATAIVVYGNRDYGIALRRLVEMLIHSGFTVVSSAAFVGQHSYFEVVPAGMGRPDEADLSIARSWGEASVAVSKGLRADEIPARMDIFARSKGYMPIKPAHIVAKCVRCGTCAQHCSAGVISAESGRYAAKRDCIGCTACVRACPNEARVVRPNFIMKALAGKVLGEASRVRREPITVTAGQ